MTTAPSLTAAPQGLGFIQPLCVGLRIDGREMMITPLVLAELPNVLAQAMPIMASLRTGGAGLLQRLKDKTLQVDEIAGLLTSLAVNGEQYVNLLALCCRQPAEWVGNLLIDRAAELMFVCLEVNADFFARALPLLMAMAARAQADAAPPAPPETPATPTPSPSS